MPVRKNQSKPVGYDNLSRRIDKNYSEHSRQLERISKEIQAHRKEEKDNGKRIDKLADEVAQMRGLLERLSVHLGKDPKRK